MKILDRVVKIAERSPFMKFGTGAMLLDKNDKIISEGWSHRGAIVMSELESVHAEIHALHRARFKKQPHTVVIATLSKKSGNVTSARPCINCALALHAAGIENVLYSMGKGQWQKIALEDLLKTELKDYRK